MGKSLVGKSLVFIVVVNYVCRKLLSELQLALCHGIYYASIAYVFAQLGLSSRSHPMHCFYVPRLLCCAIVEVELVMYTCSYKVHCVRCQRLVSALFMAVLVLTFFIPVLLRLYGTC